MIEWGIGLIEKGFKGYFEGCKWFSMGKGNGGKHGVFVAVGIDLGRLICIG